MNFGFAEKALQEATGVRGDRGELSIRGASSRGNVVEVTGLVSGTTAEDVEVRFYHRSVDVSSNLSKNCRVLSLASCSLSGHLQALWSHHPVICKADRGGGRVCPVNVQARKGRKDRRDAVRQTSR